METLLQQQDQRVQELERQLQSLREEKNLIVTQKQQLLEDNQNLQQRIHGQEAELQNFRQEKLENQRLLQQQIQRLQQQQRQEIQHLQQQQRQEIQRLQQQQRQEIQRLQQQQHSNTMQQQQQQTWLVNRNEINLKEKELGRGAYGWVKEATFRGCKVAVKCLHNELISDYNLHVFDREMTMAARCRHPNLLQFIGATNEGVPLIVTEMMHTSLRKVLERGQLSSDQIIPIAAGIAFGLNYLHKTTPSPILHRDVSSANVLLNPLPDNQWLPKLSDFGSFNFMRESQTVNAGNPVYAAPEALDPSKGPHTPAMDTFSLGVLLYEMCSRRLPSGVFSVSMLQRVNWRVPESNVIPLIAACADQMIQRRPNMDRVIAQLNGNM
ncbi:probable serine/threonine-protein kinase DDB_G0271682 [Dysidea avara]|uniref:probable serine/threonine-protein kinase DDB_G0271682 n=1 Tax=Dysidea avara TaxID=196820 RepID=UPI003316591C